MFLRVFSLHRSPEVPRSAEDLAALDEHIAQFVRQYGILVAILMLVFTLARWPLDRHVLAEAYVPTMAYARICALAVELGTLVVFVWVKPRGRAAPMAAMLGYATLVGSAGYWFGRMGPEQAHLLENGAFAIVPAALIPADIRTRTFGTLCVGTSLFLAYEISHPLELPIQFELARLVFFAFATVLTIVMGEAPFRATRTIFLERRDAEKVRQELAHLTDHLRTIVRERTEELSALAQHLESVQENERRRIARDLHDDLGQSVTAMRYTVARLRSKLDGDAASMLIEDLSTMLDGTAHTLRAVVATLSPRILEEHGLAAASEWLAHRIEETTSRACQLHCNPADEEAWEHLDPRIALVAFRVIQEGTTNALKHASPTRLDVRLELNETSVTVAVSDDGEGFDPNERGSGLGLFGLQERLRSLGGEMTVDSAVGAGTRLRATIPLGGAGPAALDETTETRA